MIFRSLILTLILTAAPAFACGDGGCDPDPEPPTPPVVEPPVAPPTPDDRDPVAPTPVIHYGVCCSIDGKMHVTTAWLRDPVKAYEQCQAREERLQSLPECPARIRERAE